jgi:ABC-type antimicrobial peptide transport system permease subunit
MLFLALDQGAVAWHGRRMTVFVRVAGDPLGLASAVRSTVSAIDPRLPIRNLQPMDAVVAQAAAAPRFRALLLGLFAGLALVLAAIGIYGVVSFSVAQRTREMAIRMALGARSSGVMRLVMRDGLSPVIAGVLLGLLVAWALSRVLTAVLFGVGATDVVVFFAVPATLLAVAALSTLGPARRALRSDPMDILRES